MPGRTIQSLIRNDRGAVAVTYALSLFGLLAVAGIGFDYARLVTMDSELQNGADQAALAAVTQLDRTPDAINRATAQASSLVSNRTIMANDGAGNAVTVATLTFYETRAQAEADTNGFTDNVRSADAHFVKVDIVARRAFYALTPIVAAFSSGNINAAATAGIGSAICKVPPVMMCNPATNPAITDVDALIGKGIRLKATGGGGAWAPGDFGFLDVGQGANDLAKLMGYANPPGDCADFENPTTEPGAITSVIKTFNTRFDIFVNGDGNINCFSGSLCPPSDNARKDVVEKVAGNGNGNGNATPTLNDCGVAANANQPGWQVTPSPYRPTAAQTYANQIGSGIKTGFPDAMGYPRDICHAWSDQGNCSGGRIGSGTWDIDAYWRTNYGVAYGNQAGANPKRYDVYQWEKTNGAATRPFSSAGTNYIDRKAPYCRPGLAAGPTTPDRRVLPVAIVNCTGLSGKKPVTPLDWVDVFLVEPSIDRKLGTTVYTNTGDIYVEIFGRTAQGSGSSANQYVRRDKPYLVR